MIGEAPRETPSHETAPRPPHLDTLLLTRAANLLLCATPTTKQADLFPSQLLHYTDDREHPIYSISYPVEPPSKEGLWKTVGVDVASSSDARGGISEAILYLGYRQSANNKSDGITDAERLRQVPEKVRLQAGGKDIVINHALIFNPKAQGSCISSVFTALRPDGTTYQIDTATMSPEEQAKAKQTVYHPFDVDVTSSPEDQMLAAIGALTDNQSPYDFGFTTQDLR